MLSVTVQIGVLNVQQIVTVQIGVMNFQQIVTVQIGILNIQQITTVQIDVLNVQHITTFKLALLVVINAECSSRLCLLWRTPCEVLFLNYKTQKLEACV